MDRLKNPRCFRYRLRCFFHGDCHKQFNFFFFFLYVDSFEIAPTAYNKSNANLEFFCNIDKCLLTKKGECIFLCNVKLSILVCICNPTCIVVSRGSVFCYFTLSLILCFSNFDM